MKILTHPSDWSLPPGKVSLAIGVFDGVHLGHQQVIRQAVHDARQHDGSCVVITFDRHPASLLAPEHAPSLIYSVPQKLRNMGSLGVDATWMIEFNEAFSQQTGREFIQNLARDLGPLLSISVGGKFKFGHQRSGDVSLLKEMGSQLKFKVHGLAAVALDGKTISSTRIRQAIRSGDLPAASQMLGRAYSLSAPVIKGKQLGRQLGFPTANLDVSGLVLPPGGVYAAQVRIGDSVQPHHAVLNIGNRPTLQSTNPTLHLETHLLDFDQDLYGQELELTFGEHLRAEQKFASLDELKAQIARDIVQARKCFPC